jgi:RNA polymerase sigma-70 factor (ECF subfamily)
VAVAPSDAELASQALAGSQEAYRTLVGRYAAPAVNLAARLVHDAALAEDLAQEAFARAFARLDRYDPQKKFSSWFFQVVHNVTVDHLRRKRLSTVSLEEPAVAAQALDAAGRAAPSPAAHAEHDELARVLSEALAQVRPEYREALVLHYQEGLTHAEIGGVMGAPVGTVKTYLHRGRLELAAIMAAKGWGPAARAPSKPSDARARRVSRD